MSAEKLGEAANAAVARKKPSGSRASVVMVCPNACRLVNVERRPPASTSFAWDNGFVFADGEATIGRG
jgi:hypothetical protein